MKLQMVIKTLGALLVLFALTMVIPLAVSMFHREPDMPAFAISIIVTLAVGACLYFLARHARGQLRSREAVLLVTLAWFAVTIFGSLPYYIYPEAFPTMVDAWFESASGFTTTGSTVITEIEALPHGTLLWRSLTQFIGGMGIIVLSVALLPLLGVGGMELYRAEVPGPTSDKISSRVSETARILWVVYVMFTIAQIVLLMWAGMSLFDAVNHTFTTMSTGGFSTKNASVAAYDSASIDAIITLFMFVAGMNLHYRLFFRGDWSILKDREFQAYGLVAVSATVLLTVYTFGTAYPSVVDAFRYSIFQVVSISSTTGYGTADYALWGPFAHSIIILLMIVGGSAGSTAGGVKCVRVVMLLKQGYRELYLLIHRKAVYPVKLGGKTVPANVTSGVFAFFFLYFLTAVITVLFITATGVDIVTAFSGTISALSNIGPGLGEVGPVLNYQHLPDLAKVLLSTCMIIGRLEIFTVLVLFTSEYWHA
ncbi:MAG: potassium transporter [Bdellovibrionales bacterium]|nr:potassium transporter [Bdellovibrionales bacterium]